MKILFYGWLAIVCLTSCSAMSTTSKEQKASLRKVAIVSIVDNQVGFIKVGVTALNNEKAVKTFHQLSVDDEIERTITHHLKTSSPTIKVEPIPYDKNALLKIYQTNSYLELYKEIYQYNYANLDQILPVLQASTAQNPLDAILLVYKSRGDDPLGLSKQYLDGIGVYYRVFPLSPTWVRYYALFDLVLIDGKTFKPIITRSNIAITQENMPTEWSWQDLLNSPESEEIETLVGSELKKLINATLEDNLTDMGL